MSEEMTVEQFAVDAQAELRVLIDTLDGLGLIDSDAAVAGIDDGSAGHPLFDLEYLKDSIRAVNDQLAFSGHANPEIQEILRNRFIAEYDQTLAEESED